MQHCKLLYNMHDVIDNNVTCCNLLHHEVLSDDKDMDYSLGLPSYVVMS